MLHAGMAWYNEPERRSIFFSLGRRELGGSRCRCLASVFFHYLLYMNHSLYAIPASSNGMSLDR